ncbi:uncharacterized protein DUF4301 [Balneicella halophila]|uniref:Uncharacterized protein DUF4301 n=1 Tax=Balneicella halophila TaxID=1537566 RepID=A0A7L4UQE8_BALHA|nr:DUF4301 family protein [Balneicella halophila]PVX50822.1 uncharacterized protein DUF4301 [Balneicella halophila]
MNLSEKDLSLLKSKGISEKTFEKQIEKFENGFPALNIVGAATTANGIKKYSDEEEDDFVAIFKKEAKKYDMMKFVPASGAATRMFKKLFEFKDSYKGKSEEYEKFIADTKTDSVFTFFETLEEYPFYEDLKQACFAQENESLERLLEKHEYIKVLDVLLTNKGLGLGFLPKALIQFHRYEEKTRTPVGEHLVSSLYLFEDMKKYKVHFTISEEFLNEFEKIADYYVKRIKDRHDIDIEVTFSYQKPSTDTVAVTRSNEPLRDDDDNMIFRPGGHGALIHNLNDVDSAILFIKNIDNVVPNSMKEKNAYYEQLLGGVLLKYQNKIFKYLEDLDAEPSDRKLKSIAKFIREELCYEFEEQKNVKQQLKQILNRPLRVCGMVINEGEPGGGPFLVEDTKGNVSLQIVESSQINLKDDKQREVFEQSTHFNPVDLVCGVKDYKGNDFDLMQFVDEQAGFITEKSLKGRNLKALELPGLWNGAMAHWNTIFVEVPDFTFNPVKTVFDLLRPQHRN